jgi:peptidoglycan hydrolase CwlO-like protein
MTPEQRSFKFEEFARLLKDRRNIVSRMDSLQRDIEDYGQELVKLDRLIDELQSTIMDLMDDVREGRVRL